MREGWMYILKCADGSYYTGSTNNLELRLAQHQAGEGANHTKKRLPVKLVYYEEYQNVADAFKREKQVQGWSRKKKEALINGTPELLPELAVAYRDRDGGFENVSNGGFENLSHQNRTESLPEVLEGNTKGWEIKKFEKCIEKVVYTKKVKRKDFQRSGEYPIISQEQEFINGYWNNSDDLFEIKKPIVIFGDHTKIVKYVDFDFVLGADGVKILQTIDEIDPRYFYYYLQNIDLGDLGYARHYRLLKEQEIKYPPLPEQKRIVSILDRAFALIEAIEINAKQNLKNAKELFESYSRTLYENLISENERGLLGNLATLVRGPFGGSLKKSMFVDKGYAVYEQRNAIGDFTDNFRYFIDDKKFSEMERFSVKTGDMLMSCSGTIGKFTIIKENYTKGIINQALLKISPNTNKIDNKFLLFVLSNFIQDGSSHSKGAAIKNIIAVKELKKIEIPLLNIDAQKQIVAQLDKLQAETKRLEEIYKKKIDNLEELKKSILQKAFNGELTGKEISI